MPLDLQSMVSSFQRCLDDHFPVIFNSISMQGNLRLVLHQLNCTSLVKQYEYLRYQSAKRHIIQFRDLINILGSFITASYFLNMSAANTLNGISLVISLELVIKYYIYIKFYSAKSCNTSNRNWFEKRFVLCRCRSLRLIGLTHTRNWNENPPLLSIAILDQNGLS